MCTGLEPLLMSAFGASASTAAAVVGGLQLAGGLAGVAGAMKKPKAQAVQAPEKPPQATKAPDRPAIAAGMAAAARPGGAMAGNSSTFLTGAGGIDPSTLNLGKNSLLGQ